LHISGVSWPHPGYRVRNGEKALRIIAPLPVKERDSTTREETGETLVLFTNVFVKSDQRPAQYASGRPGATFRV
jgi:hypothetical protein